ncbi:GTP cyclohydrolase II [Cognatazoarcus halotolerans]|uniref:GTP cyclohydrolase II n=1 Tax=Cognatazoarcus halotolerans TaxID=2686016 RepID=UPI001F31F4BC|nr:GTP cyclohydrolase II [Cognatazoarcus halotolerans]
MNIDSIVEMQVADDLAEEQAARPTIRGNIPLPTRDYGPLQGRMVTFDHLGDDRDHVAMVFDAPEPTEAPLVRIHSECLTGDVFGSLRCDCGEQLHAALHRFAAEGGVLLYLRQEGRGIGLKAKIDAYHLQDSGLDTFAANEHLGFPADARDYRVAARMLEALGIKRIRLLSSNPEKCAGLEAGGIEVSEQVAHDQPAGQWNQRYLEAKAVRFGKIRKARKG